MWFIFDLGNTLIKLAYERVLENVCRDSSVKRDALLQILEQAGGYRDMERGVVTFWDFYEFVCEKAGYRGSVRDFHNIWSNFFDGTTPGAEDLLDRVRAKYRVAFLSNSNEVHAEVIPKQFPQLFRKDDRFIFSHRFRVAKPDPEMYLRTIETLGTLPQQCIFVDDLIENVLAARAVGMRAFQYRDTFALIRELESEGLL
jgi:putative hydrolase of the HAD superfamily